MGFPTTHARRSRRPRLDRWPTSSAKMSLRRNVRLCRNKFASACQTRCASRCQSSSAILSTRSSRSGSADRRRRKSATYQANQKPHHLWHQVFLWLLCQPLGHPLLCQAHHLSTSSPPLKIPCHLISSEEDLSKTKTIMPALMIQPQRCKVGFPLSTRFSPQGGRTGNRYSARNWFSHP